MKYKGRDAFEIHLPRSGFEYSIDLEMRLAAQWAGYKWQEFSDLDGDEQSEIVATYQARNQIDGIVINENNKRMRSSRRK